MRLSGTKTGAVNQYRGLGNQLWDLAGNRPSLDLPFSETKSLVDATTGTNLVDFTRASSGTYVGSDGLIKTATTNLLTYSEEFDNGWSTQRTVVSDNQITAPNGTATADKITGDGTAGGAMSVYKTASATALTSYRISVYAKAGTAGWLAIEGFDGVNNRQAYFDLVNGAIGSISGAGMTDIAIQSVGDGWYRCSVTRTTNSGSTSIRPQFSLATADLTPSVEDTKDFYLWGAQLEQSSTVGEYVKTTSTINSAPRFDHDPTTGESLGLLVEESRTNLVSYSEDLSAWTSGGGGTEVLDSAITDPSGNTGTVYYPSISEVYIAFYANGATQIAVSCFVKQRSGETADTQLQVFQSVTGTIVNLGTVNLPIAGTFAPGGNFSDGTRTEYPNGWYRFTFLVNADPAQGTGTFTNAARIDIEGGVSTNYVWGVQVETGSFPTSYIPTAGSAVTRAADVASISGSNFSSWYRQDEGTVFADGVPLISDNPQGALSFNNNTNEEAINLYFDTGVRFQIRDNNSTQAFLSQSYLSSLKSSGAFGINNFALSDSGRTAETDLSGSIPTPDRLRIGALSSGGNFWNGTIRRLTYWPTRLPNETLQGITE